MGGTPAKPDVSSFQFPNMTGAANNAYGGSGTFTSGPFADVTGQAGQITPLTQYLIGLNQGPLAQQGINTAAGQVPQYGQLGGGSFGGAMGLQGAAGSLVPYAQDIMTQAQDPQSAVYNRALQQTLGQTGAFLGGSGVANTPYGASTIGNTAGQFNTDWQTQQLQRLIAGGQGATGTLEGAGNIYAGAQGLGAAGLGGALQGALAPYAVSSGIGGQSLQDLAQSFQLGTGAAALPQMSVQDYLSYLQGGNQANAIYNQGQIGATNAQTSAQQVQNQGWGQFGSGIMSGLNMFGALGPFGAGGAFSGFGSGLSSLFSGAGAGLSSMFGGLSGLFGGGAADAGLAALAFV